MISFFKKFLGKHFVPLSWCGSRQDVALSTKVFLVNRSLRFNAQKVESRKGQHSKKKVRFTKQVFGERLENAY